MQRNAEAHAALVCAPTLALVRRSLALHRLPRCSRLAAAHTCVRVPELRTGGNGWSGQSYADSKRCCDAKRAVCDLPKVQTLV
jgi:hypothetical protein